MNFLYSSTVESSFSNIIKKSASFVLALFLLLSSVQGAFAQEATTPIDSNTTTVDPVLQTTDPTPIVPESNIDPVIQTPVADTAIVTEQTPPDPQLSETATPPLGETQMLAMGTEQPVSNNSPKDSITSKLNISTSPLTGSLQYQIPIVVPPGRNGLSPDLKLVYSSEPTDQISPYGYGWSDNIPYIERINEKGTNKLYTENSFYSTFDGELLPNDSATNTESYGARYDGGTLLKYEFKNNTYWQVTDKLGVIYTFGSTTASRLDNPSNSSQVFRWMLQEVRDRNGNYIKYEYTKNGGQLYPYRITYTGNGVTDGIFTVNFVTENRSYVATSSKSGFPVVANYRISEIRTEVSGTWAKKYALAYTLGDNGRRQLLSSITASGRDESGNVITLPPTNLTYQTQTTVDAWQTTSLWQSPEDFTDTTGNDLGVRVLDVNGDARADIVVSRSTMGTSTYSKAYLNDGSTWNYNASWSIPVPFTLDYKDRGVRFSDVNGDGLTDILSYKEGSSTAGYINTGSGWSLDTTWNPPLPFTSTTTGEDKGVQVADINGDGLPDILQGITHSSGATTTSTYLNNGAGWTATTSFQVPLPFVKYIGSAYVDYGARLIEVNGDGLIDLVISSPSQSKAYLNTGTGWTLSGWTPPVQFVGASGEDLGVRFFDHNGDGLTDISKYSVGVAAGYINNGHNGWTSVGAWVPKYQYIDSSYRDYGARIVDVDGDGLDDVLYARAGSRGTVSNLTKRVDLLMGIRHAEGLTTAIAYKASASYFNGSALSNQRIPFNIDTVREFSVSDGLDTSGVFQYQYGGGRYYFAGPFDRRFAGYATTTTTDPVNTVTKLFFHQGDSSASGLGEYNDEASKIGRVYRTEVYDTNANLYLLSITKWDKADVVNGRVFVKPTQTTELLYDGDGDHKDRMTAYGYIDGTGNIAEQIEYGEVAASTDGSYSDTGSDTRTTSFTYATNTTDYIIGLPSTKVIKNNSGAKVAEDRYYYDTLSLGSVTSGNLTKSESWATSSTYIDTERTYNSYGLVTQELDPRNKATNFTYDTYNLYSGTTTNPLSHTTARLYDYTSGKVRQITDSNNRTYVTIYDALDRVKEEQIPDHLGTPTSLVAKATYEYIDTVGSRRIKKTENLSTATSSETYSYLDGLSRVIQERREMETSNMYSVRDLKYNRRGDLQVETLPFESTGSSRTSFNNDPVLQVLCEYDSLGRLASSTNVIGTESHRYDQWKDTITDRNGKQKLYTFDASNNLVQVEENNGTSTYTTTYTYDATNKLITITDALGNVRNFTDDGLGRRISAEDLHTVGDGAYGIWMYTYDDAGNVTAVVDPKNQTVNYTYDDINRALTEDFTGSGGTEVSYGYDVCSEGNGRLCSATTTDVATQITYDALGNLASEKKTIGGTAYTTVYTRDRFGNATKITLPDNREIIYTHNTAGQLETVSTKLNGGSTEAVVTDIDYGPHGQVVFRKYANGVESANFYDSSELYRLRKILTTTATTTGSGLSSFESMMAGPVMDGVQLESNFVLAPTGYMTDTAFLDTQTGTSTDIVVSSIEPQAPEGYTELPSLRTVNSKTFEVPGSSPDQTVERVTRLYSKPVHYNNGGSFDEINSGLVETLTGWEMMRAPYRATIAKNSNASIFAFDNNGQVLSLELVNGVKDKIGEKNTKTTEWKNKEVIFSDVFGIGTDLHVRTDDDSLHKEVFIDTLDSLGTLTKDYYELSFKIKSNKPVTLTVDGKTLKSGGTITSSNIATIKSQDGTVSYIWPPYAEDSSAATNPEYRIPITIQYTVQKDGILLTKRIPKSWLLNAQYPIHTDATMSYTTPAGDGDVQTQPYPSAWATQHADTTGRLADYTSTTMTPRTGAYQNSGGSVNMVRGFVPFNTSSIPDSANVLSATLNLYVVSKEDSFNDQYAYFTVYQGTQATTSSLINADINDCGTETNPTKGSNDLDITTVATSTYNPFVLNGTGLAWVNKVGWTKLCVREGHDATNHEPVWNGMTWKHSALQFATSEATGLTTDPYLDVVYTVVNHAPSSPTSLLAEGTTNPVGVTDTTPEFSAIYNDQDIGDVATHYRIQVSTSTTDWNYPVWDTTKLSLASSTPKGSRIGDVSYAGLLNGSTTYFWRIKFWDQYGYEGSWSAETATFVTAGGIGVTSNTMRFYSTAGDGKVETQPYPSAWATQHADTTGRLVDYTSTTMAPRIGAYNTNGGSVNMVRGFLAFDTSALPDNSVITNATVNMYIVGKEDSFNDQYGYFNIYEGKQISPTTLVNADINDCGNTENNPTKGANNLDVTNATTSQYNIFTLNATGTAWISKTGYTKLCTREGHDAQNIAPVWNNNSWIHSMLNFATSEASGTTTDPYLEITYQTTGSSSPTTTPAVSLIQDIAYEYDAVGNIIKITDISSTTAQKTITYTYDDLYRLARASTTQAQNTPYVRTYTYNPIGNITTGDLGTYTYAGTGYVNPHAPTQISGVTYSYDQNGNTLTTGANGYTWDYRNRMTTSGTGLATSTYTYDHTTERMTKTTNGITTVYPHDSWNKGGSTTTIHITDPSGTELATVEGNGVSTTTVYSHQDHLGSINVLTTQSGTLKEVSDYYPYGAPRVQTTYTGTPEQRKYLSEDYDTDSALSYLNARYYAGDRGQFLSQDPVFLDMGLGTSDSISVLKNPQAQNSYSYAQNNPIVNRDPDGRFAVGFGGDIGGNIPGIYGGGSVYLVMSATSFSDIQFGVVTSGGGGMTSAVLSAGAGVGGIYSPNARSISDLEGLDAGGGGKVVFGPGVGPEVNFGASVSLNTNGTDGRRVKTYQGSVGVGGIATPYVVPASVYGGTSYTKALVTVNGSQVNAAASSAQSKTKSAIQSQLNNLARQIKELQKKVYDLKAKLKK